MKLLFDENLSPRLVNLLSPLFPEYNHEPNVGLDQSDDDIVWSYAQEHGLVIVSKDPDFHQRSFVLGAPPKVIWIRLGNCTTEEIANLLTLHQKELEAFQNDPDGTFLELG